MVFFIAIPLFLVFFQSFHFKQDILEIVEREKCDPFGCKTETLKVPVLDEKGNRSKINIWVGWQNYKNILQFEELNSIIKNNGYSWSAIQSIDFYQALRFTITFTFITLPFVLIFGMCLALCVNNLVNGTAPPKSAALPPTPPTLYGRQGPIYPQQSPPYVSAPDTSSQHEFLHDGV